VIGGDTDRMVSVATARRYDELLPNSRLVIWSETGHMIQEQHPERVAIAIRDWERQAR